MPQPPLSETGTDVQRLAGVKDGGPANGTQLRFRDPVRLSTLGDGDQLPNLLGSTGARVLNGSGYRVVSPVSDLVTTLEVSRISKNVLVTARNGVGPDADVATSHFLQDPTARKTSTGEVELFEPVRIVALGKDGKRSSLPPRKEITVVRIRGAGEISVDTINPDRPHSTETEIVTLAAKIPVRQIYVAEQAFRNAGDPHQGIRQAVNAIG